MVTFDDPPFRRPSGPLHRERSAAFAYGLAALMGIAFVAYLFPLSFLAGHGAFFEGGDASQHVAGWRFFVADAWRFPLLHTERLNHPAGTSVAFTDSIPLAALPFKLFSAWLPAGFHYLGLWHGLAFVTQGLAAAFLIRSLDVRHALGTACAVFFALTWPAMLWRIGHPSLMTHSLVLLALAVYLRGRQEQWPAQRASTALIVLCIAGLTVHPYFLALCYPIFVAFLIGQGFAGEGWRRQGIRLLASLAAILGVAAVLGYFGQAGNTTFGYGYYSMNLSAPFCGGRLLGCAQEAVQHQFGEYRFADATGGQYEGYSYFGVGGLLVLGLALLTRLHRLPAAIARHPALVLVLLGFTAYAVSNVVYFNARELLNLPLPDFLDRLTGTFRAGGRFFWPAAYMILFAALAALLKKRSATVVLLLAVSLPLQWVDVQLLRERIIGKASAPADRELEPWAGVMAGVDKVHLYPAFGCGDVDVNLYWFIQRLAADTGKLLDTGYIARPNTDCAGNRKAFAGRFQPGRLYVMPEAWVNNPFLVPAGFVDASRRGECATWRIAVLCKAGMDAAAWAHNGLQASPLAALSTDAAWPAAKLPTQIGRLQEGRLVPTSPEASGFLSFGPYIALPPGQYHVTIRYASGAEASQAVGRWDVVMNGRQPAELASGDLRGTGGAESIVEASFTAGGEKLPLEIRTFHSGGGDLQLIGIALKSMAQ